MPLYSIPTLERLVNRARADVEAALSNGAAWLRRVVEYGIAPVWAGLAYGLYGRLPTLANDIVPGPQNSPDGLRAHASQWLGSTGNPAQPATLPITGTGTEGTTISIGTIFRRADGALYSTAVEYTFGVDQVEVVSTAAEGETGYGASGNTIVGAELTLVSEVPGIDGTWTVDGTPGETVGAGADQETHESLADRVSARGAEPPAGGRAADFVAWAREVSGVGEAWAYAGINGPGTVTVFFIRSDPDNPIPDSTLVAAVQAYVVEQAPVAAGTIQVLAPTAVALDPVVAIRPNTTAIQEAATASMRAEVLLRRSPGDGTDSVYFDRSWLTDALSDALGEEGHTLTSPATDVALAIGELPVLGTPSYSTKA